MKHYDKKAAADGKGDDRRARQLRAKLLVQGVSLRQLAGWLGMAPSTLTRSLTGARRGPKSARALAEIERLAGQG